MCIRDSNSVTRTVLKPTHMIGGYAQQAYGFNYYGTVGANRDEFVVLRKICLLYTSQVPAADLLAAVDRALAPAKADAAVGGHQVAAGFVEH